MAMTQKPKKTMMMKRKMMEKGKAVSYNPQLNEKRKLL
jgi:hypothetical protein